MISIIKDVIYFTKLKIKIYWLLRQKVRPAQIITLKAMINLLNKRASETYLKVIYIIYHIYKNIINKSKSDKKFLPELLILYNTIIIE